MHDGTQRPGVPAAGDGRDRAGGPPPRLRRRPAGRAHPRSVPAHPHPGFDQTLAKAEAKLTALADTLARGNTRRSHSKVTAAIDHIVKDPWVRRVIAWQLTGDTPADTGSP